jgi:outer membrane murein-binding lipoprotein Lpp
MNDRFLGSMLGILVAGCAAAAMAADVAPLVKTLRAVGPQGAGHVEAARAWQQLARADAGQLSEILAGLDGAGPLAANWIRTAVEAIAERQLQQGRPLPAADLERFVRDTRHAPRARRLAYEWLLRADPTAGDRLIPGMLDDPSVELRRDAVARLMGQAAALAASGKQGEAVSIYRRALVAARDLDQVDQLTERLRKLGHSVDLARQLGFLVRWKLIGPLDNTGGKGFDAAYPPEREIRLDASYPGKHGPVRWIDYTSSDQRGTVDFNKALAEEKVVTGYALAEFVADRPREVQLRMSSDNAVKLWVNGRLVDQHKVYHSGCQPDQYVSRVGLKSGRNLILVKVCQNEQTEDWARVWDFKLRICDETGGAVE